MPPQDRYRVPYAILQGLKAGMQEYQRGREQEKQDVMSKMMMGIPLTEKEERVRERVGYEIPRGATKIGGVEEEQRRHEAELERERIAEEKAEEVRENVQAWTEKKEAQRKSESERKDRIKIHNDAIDAATEEIRDPNTYVTTKKTDWSKVPAIEAQMLENAGITIPASLQAKRLGVYEEYKKARYGNIIPPSPTTPPAKTKRETKTETAIKELRKVLPKFKKKPVSDLSTDELRKLQSELQR